MGEFLSVLLMIAFTNVLLYGISDSVSMCYFIRNVSPNLACLWQLVVVSQNLHHMISQAGTFVYCPLRWGVV